MTTFDTAAPLAQALASQNFTEPTPVQTAVLAPEAAGRDLLVSAQTGSGKTVAFGLAIAANILDGEGRLQSEGAPLALIIAPTRELAMQVERELTWLYQFTGARIVSCVGGMDPGRERRKLLNGCDIVIGTPGRLRDHMERGALVVSGLRAAVLDEADEMLDLGFREDIEFILGATPSQRRTLLFSATIPRAIMALAQNYQRDSLRLEVKSGDRGHADIEYRAIRVAHGEHELAVVNVLRYFEAQTAIIFCNTREAVRHMHATLQERGFSCVLLSGELSQQQRNQSMQAVRDGRAKVCIATDVAARGIDVPNLSLVIHAELPNDAETLQHRSGRTGRAGNKGVSVMIAAPARQRKAHLLLRDANLKALWSGPPTIEEIRKLDRERFLRDPVLQTEPDEEDIAIARDLLSERPAEEVCASLLHIHRARLPAIEDVSDPGDLASGRNARDGAARSKPDRTENAGRNERSDTRPQRSGKRHEIPDGVWFRLDIGRTRNADPKWLMPMLCRKGEITREDIGAIRIFDNETKVEIAAKVAEQFSRMIRRPGGDNIRVERQDEFERRQESGQTGNKSGGKTGGPAGDARPQPAKPPYKERPREERASKPAYAKKAKPAPSPALKPTQRDATRYDWKAHKAKDGLTKAERKAQAKPAGDGERGGERPMRKRKPASD